MPLNKEFYSKDKKSSAVSSLHKSTQTSIITAIISIPTLEE